MEKCFVHRHVWGMQFDSKFPLSKSRYEFNFQPSDGERLKKKALGNDLDHVSAEITSQNQSAQKGILWRS